MPIGRPLLFNESTRAEYPSTARPPARDNHSDGAMSLVFTLASRNLFQDRLRFVAALVGIVFSVVLIMAQIGLYAGFSRMVTTMIDHASTDLWIVSKGTRYFEDLSLVDTKAGDRLRRIDGVAGVAPTVLGFSAWQLPDGSMTPVFIVGSDIAASGLM